MNESSPIGTIGKLRDSFSFGAAAPEEQNQLEINGLLGAIPVL